MRRLAALLGGVALAVGAVVALEPTRLPAAATNAVDPEAMPELVDRSLLGAAGVAFLVTLAARWLVPTQPVPPVRIEENADVADDAPVTGRSFDARVERKGVRVVASGLPKSTAGPRLDEAVVSVYARTNGLSRREAVEAVRAGEWTDDRDAALLFAAEATPTRVERLEAWLRPETVLERRIDAAVKEVDRLAAELSAGGGGGRGSTGPAATDAPASGAESAAATGGSA